jgi:hypothetical protein
LKFFGHRKIGDQNPFLVAICIRGSLNVNKYFLSSYGRDECIKTNINVTHNAKQLCHVGFDNPANKRWLLKKK